MIQFVSVFLINVTYRFSISNDLLNIGIVMTPPGPSRLHKRVSMEVYQLKSCARGTDCHCERGLCVVNASTAFPKGVIDV